MCSSHTAVDTGLFLDQGLEASYIPAIVLVNVTVIVNLKYI